MRFTSPSSLSRRLYVVSNWSPAYGEVDDRTPTDDIEAANLITSALDVPTPGGKKSAALHSPALDLDIEHVYVPSSTPGHAHLYIDGVILSWKDYLKWLRHTAKVGIIETGFVDAAEARGFTGLRVPWVKK